jgi:hypothetical protein
MKYFVSRQIVWPDGTPTVEIVPFRDSAGPDMLVEQFKKEGEGREFDDPREAAAAAIRVRDAWWAQKGNTRRLEGWEKIAITYTGMGDMGVPGEEIGTDDELQAWAEKRYAALPKCAECGGPIYDKEKCWYPMDCFKDEAFACCSEYCVEKHSAHLEEASE